MQMRSLLAETKESLDAAVAYERRLEENRSQQRNLALLSGLNAATT